MLLRGQRQLGWGERGTSSHLQSPPGWPIPTQRLLSRHLRDLRPPGAMETPLAPPTGHPLTWPGASRSPAHGLRPPSVFGPHGVAGPAHFIAHRAAADPRLPHTAHGSRDEVAAGVLSGAAPLSPEAGKGLSLSPGLAGWGWGSQETQTPGPRAETVPHLAWGAARIPVLAKLSLGAFHLGPGDRPGAATRCRSRSWGREVRAGGAGLWASAPPPNRAAPITHGGGVCSTRAGLEPGPSV